jgi:CYTH domain-containing protein
VNPKPSGGHKYARIEYERRFLLRAMPADLDPDEGYTRITDVYLEGTRLRRRTMHSPQGELIAAKFTQKYTVPGQPPSETTITNLYLDEAEAVLLESLSGPTLSKRRYRYAANGATFSIDVFEGDLAGLILAEVEAPSAARIEAVPFPDFALREVTADPAFSGAQLVRLSKADLERLLSREMGHA